MYGFLVARKLKLPGFGIFFESEGNDLIEVKPVLSHDRWFVGRSQEPPGSIHRPFGLLAECPGLRFDSDTVVCIEHLVGPLAQELTRL